MYGEGELAAAREDYRREQLTQTADVLRRDPQSDKAGGHTHLPLKPESGLYAKALPVRTPRQEVQGGRPVVVADWKVRLADPERAPETLDVLPMDTIQIGGAFYRVVSTDKGRSEALCLTVEALKIS